MGPVGDLCSAWHFAQLPIPNDPRQADFMVTVHPHECRGVRNLGPRFNTSNTARVREPSTEPQEPPLLCARTPCGNGWSCVHRRISEDVVARHRLSGCFIATLCHNVSRVFVPRD